MKTKFIGVLPCLFILFFMGSNAYADSYDFYYDGYNWGTMDMVYDYSADVMSMTYTASSSIPAGSQATGFAFNFSYVSPLVLNYPDLDTSLTWIELVNLNAIPNAANSGAVKGDFNFGVTEGKSNNYSSPGILPGASDTFQLSFASIVDLEPSFDIMNLIGVRLQSLPDEINGGSLFLTGTPVPEPATMLLFGTGLAGLAGYARKKKK